MYKLKMALIFSVFSFSNITYAVAAPTNALDDFFGIFTPCYGNHENGASCYSSQEAYESSKRSHADYEKNLTEQAHKPSASQKKLMGAYFGCVYRSLASGELERPTFQNCLTQGIALCNDTGIPTSTDYQISAVTGRVALNNNRCGQSLEGWFGVAVNNFDNEYDNYERSEAAGVAYQPFAFDLRQYFGN